MTADKKPVNGLIRSFPVPEVGLNFSGERFTTAMTGSVEQEHRHRYLFALNYCAGKRILDIASGEGYGSAMLATVAEHVTGVDISPEAIAHAKQVYAADNLTYLQGSATDIPLPDQSVDVVVSFETIEHFHDHERFLQEVRRVMRPNGLFIISSPNKEVYSESPDNHNEFHVRELTKSEFEELIGGLFKYKRSFRQKATAASLLLPDFDADVSQFTSFLLREGGEFQELFGGLIRDVYSLIVASDAPITVQPGWGVLEDETYVGKLVSIVRYNEWLIAQQKEQLGVSEATNEERLKRIEALEQEQARLKSVELELLNKIGTLEQRLHSKEAEASRYAELLTHANEAVERRSQQLEEASGILSAAEAHARELQRALDAVYASTSWKISAPVRAARTVAQAGKKIAGQAAHTALRANEYVRERGLAEAMRNLASPGKLKSWLQVRPMQVTSAEYLPRYEMYNRALPGPASSVLMPKVLLVAELSLPQCTKYRVKQKAGHFEHLGIPVQIIEWWRADEVRKALQTATIAIWYRVPGYPEHLDLIKEAKRLGVTTFWEVDDLIFDEEAYTNNSNLSRLTPELRKGVLEGIPLYRAALAEVDHVVASTRVLAREMQKVCGGEAFVVENCLDEETLGVAEKVREQRSQRPGSQKIRIVYGSGSKAHDVDFECAAEGLAAVLKSNPDVILELIGDLSVPPVLAPFASQIERTPFRDFPHYLERLGGADISLAPLESTIFNDAKSNIKYLEAAILGLPCVCSPADAFSAAIIDGETGMLASTPSEWERALRQLVDSAELRESIGAAAYKSVIEHYHWQSVAMQQVAPLWARFQPQETQSLKVLVANIFFAPQSFGGATIVAEEVVQCLAGKPDTEVSVFASFGEDAAQSYSLKRYPAKGADCISIKLPGTGGRRQDYANPRMLDEFRRILAARKPDIVHLHSIQGLSASIAEACAQLDIPFVVTLHDAWWICERQFMVMENGRYCFQSEIDLKVCEKCVPDFAFTVERRLYLDGILSKAALLLTPSEFQRGLYVANGVAPNRIRTNKNGVRKPANISPKPTGKTLRFAHVGGKGPIKGQDLIFKAFNELPFTDYELKIVDNTQNLGFSSHENGQDAIPGKLTYVPAYTQDSIDEFFEGVDVLLFPSQWKESFGLTVREALIRNVWVIATDGGGTAEDIVDGVNGTIIPLTRTPDHAALKEAIRDLLEHPERLDNYENPHKDRITTFDQQADQLREILLEIVEQHARGTH